MHSCPHCKENCNCSGEIFYSDKGQVTICFHCDPLKKIEDDFEEDFDREFDDAAQETNMPKYWPKGRAGRLLLKFDKVLLLVVYVFSYGLGIYDIFWKHQFEQGVILLMMVHIIAGLNSIYRVL